MFGKGVIIDGAVNFQALNWKTDVLHECLKKEGVGTETDIGALGVQNSNIEDLGSDEAEKYNS